MLREFWLSGQLLIWWPPEQGGLHFNNNRKGNMEFGNHVTIWLKTEDLVVFYGSKSGEYQDSCLLVCCDAV